MGLSAWQQKQNQLFEAAYTMEKETSSLSALVTGDSPLNVYWLACWTLIAACLIAVVILRLGQPCQSPSGDSLPSRAAPRRKQIKDTPQTFDGTLLADISKDYVEVTLERSRGQSWGLVWHVQAIEVERFLIAGLEPKSPAGLLKDRQAQGLRPLRRGDELVSVNGTCHFQSMLQQLARAERVRLQFLKADVVLPLECETCDSPTATTKPGPAPSQNSQDVDSPRSPSSVDPSQDANTYSTASSAACPAAAEPTSFLVEVAEAADVQCSPAICAVEHSTPALPPPDSTLDSIFDAVPQPAPAKVRGRDTAVKRADVPNWCKEKRKSRRHASTGAEEEGRFSSNSSGSGSEQASGESKCPSTDWEYMMDHRPGSMIGEALKPHSMRPGAVASSTSNVVIVAGSQAMALQTASALGTVVGGGVLHPGPEILQDLRAGHQLPLLASSQVPVPVPGTHIIQAPAEASGLGRGPHVPCGSSFMDAARQMPLPLHDGFQHLPLSISGAVPITPSPSEPPDVRSHRLHDSSARPVPSQAHAPEVAEAKAGNHAAATRSGSAPARSRFLEACEPKPAKKRTYRSGKRIRAKRTRAAARAMQDEQTLESQEPAKAQPAKALEVGVIAKRSRAGSAPAAIRSLETLEDCWAEAEGSPAEKGYFKPRRRAGKKVRQRMEHAIARRREQALMAEAAENCRMVSDDEHERQEPKEALEPKPQPVAKAASQSHKRADSPTSTVSTCTTAAATMVSGVASTATTSTGSDRAVARRSFYARKLHEAPLPTMQEGCRVPDPAGQQDPALSLAPVAQPTRAQRRTSRTRGSQRSAELELKGAAEQVIGQRVLLTGLFHAPHFNGHWGHVDGFDAEQQRYTVRVFLGQPGTPPTLAKLRRECFIVPKGPGLEERQRQFAAWQPSLRLLADDL